ncbi:Vacuolar amino acid transporter 5 [Nosema granulosis]|uniref:Vacuolar amino acid transporter 5 n=1 Tax=Nosema granulosis TaxID=83296 RepID=A0A9P6KZ38_9MICR|nr:Vacuolar amino acid transporter 5 [Nosema granulosis]
MLGAGINFMPSAFESIGYLYAGLIMTLITLLTIFTLYAISYSVQKQTDTKDITYSSIGYNTYYMLGVFVDLSIVLALYLICLAFFNYVVEMAVLFFTGLNTECENFNRYKILFMTGIMILFYFVSLKKDLGSLKYTSYAGVASVFYLIFLVIFLNFFIGDNLSKGTFNARNNEYHKGVSMLLLAMSCQINMVKVYTEMKVKSTMNILIVALVASVVGGAIYSTVGFFGYRLFGESAKDKDIINIFSDKSSFFNVYLYEHHPNLKYLPSIAVIGAMIVLMGSFPLQINPAASTIVKLIASKENANKVRISTITIICLSIYIINFVPKLNLGTILGVVGAVFSNFLSFIAPCLYYIAAHRSFGVPSLISILLIISSVLFGVYMLYNIAISFTQ